jgi:uncharacterized protein
MNSMVDIDSWRDPNRVMSAAGQSGRVIVGRVLPGMDLIEGVAEICKHHEVRQALIVEVIGSLLNPRFTGYARGVPASEARPGRVPHVINVSEGPAHLLSGQGIVCRTEDSAEPVVHMHCVFEDAEGNLRGGCFRDSGTIVLSTVEVSLIEVTGLQLIRRRDLATGRVYTVPSH